jgi:hypothetical protein
MQLLEASLAGHSLQVIGMQETRIQSDAVSRCGGFTIYSAPADKHGTGGTQLWLTHALSKHVSATVIRSPQLLRVALSVGKITIHIIVGHAPPEAVNDADSHLCDVFWGMVAEELIAADRTQPSAALLLIDGNARVGSIPSSSIGCCEPQTENGNGERMRLVGDEFNLAFLNTFLPAGPTWTGAHGHSSRIDYIGIPSALRSSVTWCKVIDDIDLATSEREDHRVLACHIDGLLTALCGDKPELIASVDLAGGAVKYSEESLRCPASIAHFRELLRNFSVRQSAGGETHARAAIDTAAEAFAVFAKEAAALSFQREPVARRKGWMTKATWTALGTATHLRSVLRSCSSGSRRLSLSLYWGCWRSLLPHDMRMGHVVQEVIAIADRALTIIDSKTATAQFALYKVMKLRRPLIRRDKLAALDEKAATAASASAAGNSKKLYSIVRTLSGQPAAPAKCVADADGNVLTDASAARDHWRDHFTEVFKATVVDDISMLKTDLHAYDLTQLADECAEPPRKRIRVKQKPFEPSIADVHAALMRLNGTKGMGCDQLSASILQAGGWEAAVIIHELIQLIVRHGYIPIAWRGGRLVVLYKGKGSPRSTDSYRGLLVSDHLAKVLTSLLQCHLNDSYAKQVGEAQFGAVAARGTTVASLALRCFHDAVRIRGLSSFTLFLDLSKAFDYAVREVVLGWLEGAPTTAEDRADHFKKLGLGDDASVALVDFIAVHGHVFEQLGTNPDAAALARSLHTSAWFQLPGDTQLIVTRSGGRQGCKLGAMLFNLIYSVALRRITAELAEQGIVLRITATGTGPFWGGACSNWHWGGNDGTPFVEITYVDDEAMMLAARSPAMLVVAYNMLLRTLCDTFAEFGFVINWSEGKTEAIVRYRGRHAASHARSLAATSSIPLPCGSLDSAGLPQRLRVVDSYKHLGSMVDPDNRVIQDAGLRASKAMASFAPLSVSLFGARAIPRRLKLSLMTSLILSRLLYNVATWPTVPLRAYQVLNAVYMRVLRRIVGKMCFGISGHDNDLSIRSSLGVSSLSILIARRRLMLLASVLRCNSQAVSALLSTTVPGTLHGKLPWVELLISDMLALQLFHNGKLDELGCPIADAPRWHAFILSYPGAWRDLVGSYSIVSVDADACTVRRPVPGPCVAGGIRPWACSRCPGVSFFTSKALCSHSRAMHGSRNDLRRFIGPSASCPVCCVQFANRPKALAHLQDGRRRGGSATTCKEIVERGIFSPLPDELVRKLDLADRELRRSSMKLGWTQPRSAFRTRRAAARAVPIGPPAHYLPCKRRRVKGPVFSDGWIPKRHCHSGVV